MDLTPWFVSRDHVNSFWDTSTPICQSESLAGIYTEPFIPFLIKFIIHKLTNFYMTIDHLNVVDGFSKMLTQHE